MDSSLSRSDTISRFLVGASWSDAPHLDEKEKADLLATIPPYQRDSRTRGIPQLGAGAVYPIPESQIVIPDIPIPTHWRRGYGMDVGGGSKPTAAVFGAYDPETDTLYITANYKHASPEPSQHAAAIKRLMGDWTWPGVGDAAALILTEHDAEQLVSVYLRLGLDLHLPDKSVETGIKEVYDRMVLGKFKVFASCFAWLQEFRLYQRDKHGRIKKVNDHLQDGTRYLCRSGIARMKCKPVKVEKSHTLLLDHQRGTAGLEWMGG